MSTDSGLQKSISHLPLANTFPEKTVERRSKDDIINTLYMPIHPQANCTYSMTDVATSAATRAKIARRNRRIHP